MYKTKLFNTEKKKYRIYESVVAFLIAGSRHTSAVAVGKEQRNINEEMHFLHQIKSSRPAHKEPN